MLHLQIYFQINKQTKKLWRVPHWELPSPCSRHIVRNCILEYLLLRLCSRGNICFLLRYSVNIKKVINSRIWLTNRFHLTYVFSVMDLKWRQIVVRLNARWRLNSNQPWILFTIKWASKSSQNLFIFLKFLPQFFFNKN